MAVKRAKYNVYNGTNFDEIRFTTEAELVEIKDTNNKFNATNVEGALEENADKLESHKAESASKHITESGSNTNGKYIKFDDGTQICWMQDVVLTKMGNTLLGTTHPFPSAFVNAEVSIAGTFSSLTNMYEGNVSYDIVQGLQVGSIGSVGVNLRCYLVRGAPALDEGSKITVPCVIAVGRWK